MQRKWVAVWYNTLKKHTSGRDPEEATHLLQILCPNEFARSVLEIDLDALRRRGIRGFIIDLDNTLLGWEHDEVSREMKAWVQRAQKQGFALCIASNGLDTRVRGIASHLGIPAIAKAVKPRKRPFRRALEILDLPPDRVAVVGDQIFTDVLGGNRMDLYTILINPVSRQELRTTKMVRRVERRVINRLHKKGYLSAQALRIRSEE